MKIKTPSTLADIARLAGVSKTAVSLVINHKAQANRLSPRTVEKIRRLVKQHNFAPSQFARGFRLRSTRTVGLVVSDLTNRFSSLVAQSVEATARPHGFHLVIGSTQDDPGREKEVVRTLLAQSVDGLILSSVQTDGRLHRQIVSHGRPVVYYDRLVPGVRAPAVATDNYAAAQGLARHLLSRGFQRIAFIGGLAHVSTEQERLAGFKDALRPSGLKPACILAADFSIAAGAALAGRLLQDKKPLPDAVFTASFTLLEGFLSHLKKSRGLPPAFGLATFDDHPLLDLLPFPVASVQQDCEKMGQEAFRLFLASREGKKTPPPVRLPAELIIR